MVGTFLLPLIGILATLFSVSSTLPQIMKGLRTKQMDDVSIWLIVTLILGLSLGHSNRRREFRWCIIKFGIIGTKVEIFEKAYLLSFNLLSSTFIEVLD